MIFLKSHLIRFFSLVALIAIPAMASAQQTCLVESSSSHPSPAVCDTKMVPDDDTSLGSRTPVILIHGIHGNRWPDGSPYAGTDSADLPYPDYFRSLISFLRGSQPDFDAKYKVYRFHYISDQHNVTDIGGSLRDWIDFFTSTLAYPDFDTALDGSKKKLIIVAHSMGGLVARSFLNEHHRFEGQFSGDWGGESVNFVITLATPHNGTPLANGLARTNPNLNGSLLWGVTFDLLSGLKWYLDGCLSCAFSTIVPNRSDLRWINVPNLWSNNTNYTNDFAFDVQTGQPIRDVNENQVRLEHNDWLGSIPHLYDSKIIAYYGSSEPNDYLLFLGQQPSAIVADSISQAHVVLHNDHTALEGTAVLLARIMEQDFDRDVSRFDNDGFVPASSGGFFDDSGQTHARRAIRCLNYDHLYMQVGFDIPCQDGLTLFGSVGRSFTINPLTTETISTPTAPNGPSSRSFLALSTVIYSTTGAISNIGHPMQYMFDWGDGTNSGWLPVGVTTASPQLWVLGAYTVRVMARCALDTTLQSDWSPGLTVTVTLRETVSTPNVPTGPVNGTVGVSYSFSTGGATSNAGNPVRYLLDWGDGTNSGLLPIGVTTATHVWLFPDSYSVTATAYSATDPSRRSNSSSAFVVSIADPVNPPPAELPTGSITTVAGGGTNGLGDGGPATSAQLYAPEGVALDTDGNLYIADFSDSRIRKVTMSRVINTVAGVGGGGFFNDGGLATSAGLNNPLGVAVDTIGNIFIADVNNNRIRKVTPSGVISTVAGTGVSGFSGDGGQATSARLAVPLAVAVDTDGNLYIADHINHRIRKVTAGGLISTIAGNGTAGFSGDGGPATSAGLKSPSGVTVDTAGNIFIADTSNNRIRKVAGGLISTIAGNGTAGFSGDGGPATSAGLKSPSGVTVDTAGNIFIADTSNNRIRKVAGGLISTIAGNGTAGFSGDGGPATSAELNNPWGIAFDIVGNLYIADGSNFRVRKVIMLLTQPKLISLSSSVGIQGTNVPITLTGSGFVAGLSVDAGIGISVNNINVISATSATAMLEIGGNTGPGDRNITVTTTAGTSNPVLFTIAANHAPEAVGDFYKVDKAGTLNVPAPGVLGNDLDADGNLITAVLMTSPIHGSVTLNADGSFSYVHNGSDVISDSFTYKINDGLADSNLATVKLTIEGLFVNQFQATSSGFVAVFDGPIDATVLNLYNTETGGLGPPDVTLVGVGGGAVTGSLVVSGNGGTVTFIRTGGILPPDTYTATLRSAANGFKGLSVGLLDGNRDGIAGDRFSTTFTIASSSAVVLSVPDFTRGPGQSVNLSGTGIPVTLSDGAGVSQVDLVLKYDSNLLLLSAVLPGAALPPGATVQADFSLPDRVHITVTTAFPMNAGSVELVRITGQVPATATFGASQIMSFAGLSLNSGAIPVIGDDGLHIAAFIGDTTGNGSYSSLDAQRILRVVSGLDSGFAAFARIDPVIVGDITGNGVLSSLDATRLLQEIVGIDRPEIPPLP
jgi:sugar lactone lactonase YvrE/pimeloyl-ACP methyl ester carboxylesterase